MDQDFLNAARLWLTEAFAVDFTGYPDHAVQEFVNNDYPTGWDGFVQDLASASAVS